MADKGPIPLRSEERRRVNAPAHPIWKLGPDELRQLPFEIDLSPTPPPLLTKSEEQAWKDENPDRKWGRLVTEMYEAIKRDPMVSWMTSADWAAMMIFLEDLDRELRPQVVGVTPATYSVDLGEVIGGDVITATVPMKGASKNAILSLFKTFGIGEGNRLRLQKEITLFGAQAGAITVDDENDIVETRLELLQGGAS